MYRLQLKQCHHCLAFDHLRPYCPFLNFPKPCYKCGMGDHIPMDCPNNLDCINCSGAHHAFSKNCPHYYQTFKKLNKNSFRSCIQIMFYLTSSSP